VDDAQSAVADLIAVIPTGEDGGKIDNPFSVIPSGVEESLTISETLRDVSTSLDMTRASDGTLCQAPCYSVRA
jgi:hypothetical protein